MLLSDSMDPFIELTLLALVFSLLLFSSCVLLYNCLIWMGVACDIIYNIVSRAEPGPHFGGHPSEQPRAGGCGADNRADGRKPHPDGPAKPDRSLTLATAPVEK